MITYKLTTEEIVTVTLSAYKEWFKARYIWRDYGARLESRFTGKIGELGYSKHTSIPYNFEYYPNKGDGGEDFPGVQVKTCNWGGANKQLKVGAEDSSIENPNVNKFVLMYANPSLSGVEVSLVGEISKENFLKKKVFVEKKTKKESYYIVDEKDLDIKY